jgi:hypothetical protein
MRPPTEGPGRHITEPVKSARTVVWASTSQIRRPVPRCRSGPYCDWSASAGRAVPWPSVSGRVRRLCDLELEPEVRDWLDSLSDSDFKRVDEVCGMLAEKGTELGGSDQEVRVGLYRCPSWPCPGPASGSGRPAHCGGAVL